MVESYTTMKKSSRVICLVAILLVIGWFVLFQRFAKTYRKGKGIKDGNTLITVFRDNEINEVDKAKQNYTVQELPDTGKTKFN